MRLICGSIHLGGKSETKEVAQVNVQFCEEEREMPHNTHKNLRYIPSAFIRIQLPLG